MKIANFTEMTSIWTPGTLQWIVEQLCLLNHPTVHIPLHLGFVSFQTLVGWGTTGAFTSLCIASLVSTFRNLGIGGRIYLPSSVPCLCPLASRRTHFRVQRSHSLACSFLRFCVLYFRPSTDLRPKIKIFKLKLTEADVHQQAMGAK